MRGGSTYIKDGDYNSKPMLYNFSNKKLLTQAYRLVLINICDLDISIEND